MKSFHKICFSIQSSVKIIKDNIFNRITILKLGEDSSKYDNENFSALCDIIKEGDKYYFVPFITELGTERETIKDVSWLIYNKKTEPEINEAYYPKEGDIIKLGNSIFQIKMIQINNISNNNNNLNNVDNNDENDTLMIGGSANHSILMNDQDNIESLKTQKILIYPNTKDKTKEKNNDKVIDIKQEKIKNKICRICYQEEDDSIINPLIKPCKCSGSMKYIHMKCLLFWLKSRTVHHQNNSLEHNNYFNSYFINKEMQCELCKENFPDYIKHNHMKYCLIDLDYYQENKIKKNTNQPAQNYINTNNEMENNNEDGNNSKNTNFIVLDTIYPLSDGNKYRCIVKFNEQNEILIGRGLENQLVLNEITVSRTHCLLTAQRNKFGKKEVKLEDDGSKFGTLILLQSNKYEIIKGKPLYIQIGNVFFVLKIPIQKSILSCCNVDVVDEKTTYEKINSQTVKNKYRVNVLTEGNSDDENDNKDNNENTNNINIKNTENNNKNEINLDDKIKKAIDNIDNNKEDKEKHINEDKKSDLILFEMNKEDILKMQKKEEQKNTEMDNSYRDKDKKSVIITIKRNKIIEDLKEEIKNVKTSPENNDKLKKSLDIKSVKIINKEMICKEPSNKDIESIIVVEDESEKN